MQLEKHKIYLLVVTVLLIAFLVGINLSWAAIPGPSDLGVTDKEPISDAKLPEIIARISGWLFGLLLILATVFIVAAAYYFLTAAGSEDNLSTAKKLIIYAVVAIIVAFLSRTVVSVTEYFLWGSTLPPVSEEEYGDTTFFGPK